VTILEPKMFNPSHWPPSKMLATFEDGQGFIEDVQTMGLPRDNDIRRTRK
jgi:hypothetical protein